MPFGKYKNAIEGGKMEKNIWKGQFWRYNNNYYYLNGTQSAPASYCRQTYVTLKDKYQPKF